MIILHIKKLHPNAVEPKQAMFGDAGFDLTVTEINETNEFIECKFGISVQIPYGYFGLMTPRSNITKMNVMMKNSVGVIDSGYRGELMCRFKKVKFEDGSQEKIYKVGDRAAQLLILPVPNVFVKMVDELAPSDRGANGWGSTNKN